MREPVEVKPGERGVIVDCFEKGENGAVVVFENEVFERRDEEKVDEVYVPGKRVTCSVDVLNGTVTTIPAAIGNVSRWPRGNRGGEYSPASELCPCRHSVGVHTRGSVVFA